MNDTVLDCELDPVSEEILLAIQYITTKMNPSFGLIGVLKSQISNVIHNKFDIEEGLHCLREKSIIKEISCNSCGIDDLFIIQTESYIQDVESLMRCQDDAYQSVKDVLISQMKNTSYISMGSHAFHQLFSHLTLPKNIDPVSVLQDLRLISRKSVSNQECYFLTHPKLGIYSQHLMDGRKHMVSFLKKRKNKEIELSLLQQIIADTEHIYSHIMTNNRYMDSISSSSSSVTVNFTNNTKGKKRKRDFTMSSGTSTTPSASEVLLTNLRVPCQALGLSYILIDMESIHLIQRHHLPDHRILIRLYTNTCT